ncbi:alanine--glyoxylate aminotransferase family protein [Paenibacillus sp. Marseille-Q4541]|uniref:pyridoxal-phosphate-dependent aminotransferase family protein n=1 Tax=Paenibacillus sp. Marseille-Q4541 TaxID=2831522 RepID=UPI00201A0A41|nr:alanine--glyoxylate aminotransferase family protein [Paenibacillus sp. Marseille-Q4541]
MKKHRMATPGPTYVPQEILLAGAQELIHHRSPHMEEIMEEVNEGLPVLFGTEQKVFTMLSSGTGAMEAAVANCFQEQDKVLVVSNGYFGERFADIARVYGVEPIEIVSPWGTSVDILQVEEAYFNNPEVKGILVVYSETSTGVTNDIERIGQFFQDKDVLVVVDAISGLLSHELQMDNWGIDVVLAASHKGFMMPPGLAFVSISEKAWTRLEKIKAKTYYFSFKRFKKFYPMSPSSPGVSLIFALRASINMLMREGLKECYQRHQLIAEATQKGLESLGFELFVCDPVRRSNTVTTALAPQGLDTSRLLKILSSEYGMTVTGGQGEFKGKMIRVGHIGSVDFLDLFSVFGAIELALSEMGVSFTKGASTVAIQDIKLRGVYDVDFIST